jgi:hypothetical protein
MALIFMSSGTGHDEDVGRIESDEADPSARWDRRR